MTSAREDTLSGAREEQPGDDERKRDPHEVARSRETQPTLPPVLAFVDEALTTEDSEASRSPLVDKEGRVVHKHPASFLQRPMRGCPVARRT